MFLLSLKIRLYSTYILFLLCNKDQNYFIGFLIGNFIAFAIILAISNARVIYRAVDSI